MRFLTISLIAFVLSSTSCYRSTVDDAYLTILSKRLEQTGCNIDTLIRHCEQGMVDGYYFAGISSANYINFIKHVQQTGELSISDFHINQLDHEALTNLDININLDSLGKTWEVGDSNNISFKMLSIFDEIEAEKDISPTIVATSILNHIQTKDFNSPLYRLLFFKFLSGSINTDQGLRVALPDYPDSEIKTVPFDSNLVLEIMVNSNDTLLVGGKSVDLSELTQLTKKFLLDTSLDNNNNSVDASRKIVSLKNQRGTSVTRYVNVYNELIRAYNEVRNELALDAFGTPFKELESQHQNEIRKQVPMRISEAEPIDD